MAKAKKSRWRRIALRLLLAWVVVSVLPVLVFRWVPPPGSMVILERRLSEGQAQRFDWTPWREMSPWAGLAVMAGEDQKFPYHWGVDLDSLSEAVAARLDGGRLRGASTISQQVARNLFLWQGRSFFRKGLEFYFTMLLEALWPKERILEVYLNIAQTGPRMFGFGPAARRYFDRPAKRLNARQAALIAATLPNPVLYRADAPSAFVRERRDWILRQMRQLGGLEYLKTLHRPATSW
jgi:monofunctional glycosyltransferase